MRKLLRERQIHVVGRVDAIRNNEGAVIEFVRELIGGVYYLPISRTWLLLEVFMRRSLHYYSHIN